ncbi:hypothetical protein GF318_04710 [Candidatus Micrarchaeota archaeon]|nr:hypothetical protein [Candidatus Micrarchaeota archaeon]
MKKHFNNRVTYMLAVIAYERSEISRNSKELRMRLYQKQVESLAKELLRTEKITSEKARNTLQEICGRC